MNLIVDRRLDLAERQLIQALTLKKRQSKKSHMSEKQVLARQQLADELLQVRKPTIGYARSQSQLASVGEPDENKCRQNAKHLLMLKSKSSASLLRHHRFANSSSHQFLATCSCTCNTSCTGSNCACDLSTSSSHLYALLEPHQSPQDHCQTSSSSTNKSGLAAASSGTIASHCDTTSFHHLNNNTNHHHHHHHQRISSVGSSCSFSRSDSSYSGSSQDSGAHMHMILEKQQPAGASESHSSAGADTTKDTYSELESTTIEGDARANEGDEVDDKKASIKFNKSRLERLNAELEKRLYQYEYLVAQEKALLGTYNLMLFTSEGVNNFAY